jgi:hypothetical protein
MYANLLYALDAFPPDYQKKRVLISTDIGGGDPDDTQSMIHFLAYANMFDVEGIVISRPKGKIEEMHTILKAYKRDYRKFKFVSPDYPTPEYLQSITKVGAKSYRNGGQKTPYPGHTSATSGSNWIVKMARKTDSRPLHILVWGSATDVAQAVHDAPDIKSKIRVHLSGTGKNMYNYYEEPRPTDYLRSLSGLYLIDGCYGRGIYWAGMHNKVKHNKYGNVGFVSQVIRPRGSLGRLYHHISRTINTNAYGLKMGDTGTVLFLMNGSFKNPFTPSWGGQYCRNPKDRNHYLPCEHPHLEFGGEKGAASVAKYRTEFLKDWEKRLVEIYDR